MKSKVVTIEELQTDNPTFCLSPLRVFEKCPECPVYKLHQATNTINKLKCKPHINPKYTELAAEKRKLLDRIAEIEKEQKEEDYFGFDDPEGFLEDIDEDIWSDW